MKPGTRNMFCEKWYLPHSWVYYNRHCHLVCMSQLLAYLHALNCHISTSINKGYVAYFSLLVQKPALFLLSVCNQMSPLCSSTPVSSKMREFWRFGHKLVYTAYFFNVHVQNCPISISGLKSDITIMFSDPNLLYDVGILAICEHFRQ